MYYKKLRASLKMKNKRTAEWSLAQAGGIIPRLNEDQGLISSKGWYLGQIQISNVMLSKIIDYQRIIQMKLIIPTYIKVDEFIKCFLTHLQSVSPASL